MTTEYNVGDLVEISKGDVIIRDRLAESNHRPGNLYLPNQYAQVYIGTLPAYGWTVTVIEKAAPKNVLPTEPGIYVTEGSEVWEKVPLFLLGDQSWQFANGEDASEAAANWSTKAPLTKLEPVPVTAKKVIERFEKLHLSDNMWLDDVAVISAEFGVSS